MINAFERMVAGRYLVSRRREGFISVIAWFSLAGIAIGVATLIVVMGVFNGARTEFINQILRLNGHMTVFAGPAGIGDYEGVTAEIAALDGVTAAYPVIQSQALVSHNNANFGIQVRGVTADYLMERAVLQESLDLDPATYRDRVLVIGNRMAERLALMGGEEIRLISPSTSNTAFGQQIRQASFQVVDRFNVGYFEFDNSVAYMPLEMAQVFFQQRDRVSAIEIFVENPQAIDTVREAVRDALAGYPDLAARAGIVDWEEANQGMADIILIQRDVMFIVLSLIIIVAVFNIISGLVMLVRSKSKAIAIMRTMGASRASIQRIFLTVGTTIGLVGTLAGLVLGVVVATNLEAVRAFIQSVTGVNLLDNRAFLVSSLNAELDPVQIAVTCALAVFLSFLATLYPSWAAARIHPVEALRNE
ncbi:MAG: lipoprotein-releasing ABC transporter permease subunit [Azospirillaceae bacterium]